MRKIVRFSITVIAIIVFMGGSCPSFAKATNDQETVSQATPPSAVTQEDLNRVESEVRKARKATADLAKEAGRLAEESRLNREEAATRDEESERRATEAQEKFGATITSAVETQRLEMNRWNTRMIWSGVGGVVLVTIFIVFGIALARSKTKVVEVRVVEATKKNRDGILVDPENVRELWEYSERNGGINPVPFKLTLQKEGVIALCEAQLKENSEPLIVKVNGKKGFLRWKNRVRAVAKFLTDNNLFGTAEKIKLAS